MAGGPVHPYSAVPIDAGKVFPHVYDDGTNLQEEGLGLANATDVVADVIWRLRFEMPQVLPSGTAKMRLRALADATTGVVRPNVKWASVAMEENPPALNAEGVLASVTWGTNDNDQYKEQVITLDADTIVADEIVHVDLTFEDTSMTLAVISVWSATIIWE